MSDTVTLIANDADNTKAVATLRTLVQTAVDLAPIDMPAAQSVADACRRLAKVCRFDDNTNKASEYDLVLAFHKLFRW